MQLKNTNAHENGNTFFDFFISQIVGLQGCTLFSFSPTLY